MIIILITFLFSLLIAMTSIPLFAIMAKSIGLVDKPDNTRKLHQNSIPMVGGLALFVAVPVTSCLVICWAALFPESYSGLTASLTTWIPELSYSSKVLASATDIHELLGLLISATVLLLVGVLDDRFGIRGRQKLVGQILAVTVLILYGYKFEHVYIAGQKIEFGVFSGLVIYAWILGAINSVNLLDGADGIAATIGIVMSLSSCVMALLVGSLVDAIVASAIAGALLGFLKFNFPPAKVYLGDAGSMLIGLLLSALAIRCTLKQNSAYAFFAPVALLAIPFIDTAAAIIRRRLTGRSIFAVDRGHLHHTLMKRGYSPRVSLLWVALLCSTTAAGAVLSLAYRQSEYAVVSIIIVLFVMIGFKIFGLAEYQLVTRRANSLARSLFHIAARNLPDVLQSSVHVQGSRDWQFDWKQLCDFADEHQLNQLTLDVNAPWIHESFHATRRRADIERGECKEWYSLIPLVAQGRSCGRVEIHGSHQEDFNHHDVIRNLLKITSDLEHSLVESAGKIPTLTDPAVSNIDIQLMKPDKIETAVTPR